MEFYQVVEQRRTTRDFQAIPVEEEVLTRILEAGLKAPTHDHQRDWEFVLLQSEKEKDRGLQFVANSAALHAAKKLASFTSECVQKQMYADAMPKQLAMLRNSSCVILPFFKAGPALFSPESVSSLNSISAMWCCVENIFLAAAAEGLACSVRIPVGDEGERVRRVLGVPEEYVLACYIGLGVPAEDAFRPEQPVCRLEDKIHRGKWCND